VFLIGGSGLANFGNGAVAGGGGYGILMQNRSIVDDTSFITTVAGGYGGFIFGGGWSNRKNALTITALIGGGGLGVDVSKKYTGSPFDRPKFSDEDWTWRESSLIIEGAGFFAFEPQLTYAHSIMRWFHIGVEAGALLMHSRRGFDYANGFTTVNPTAKLRLVFGRI